MAWFPVASIVAQDYPSQDEYEQVEGRQVIETGFVFTLGSPEGELSDYLTEQVFGFHAFFGGRRSMASPVMLGTEFGLELYGSDRYTETGEGSQSGTITHTDTYNNIGSGHLFVRFQPPDGFARPYIEALAGLKVFFATRVISFSEPGYDETSSTTVHLDGAAFSYGIGGGLSLNLLDVIVPENPGQVFFTIGARYLLGAEANYLIPAGVSDSSQNRSETHILETRFGVEIRFK
jgi:hypothetical protein